MDKHRLLFIHTSNAQEKKSKPKYEVIQNMGEWQNYLSLEGYFWFDFVNPSPDELKALAEPLGLHPLAIEDSLSVEQYPKLDAFPKHTFLIINDFEYHLAGEKRNADPERLILKEIDCFLSSKYVVTVHNGKLLRHMDSESEFLQRFFDDELLNRGADFLLHKIVDMIIDQKFSVLENIQDKIIDEEQIKSMSHIKLQERLIYMRRNLLQLRKSLFYEREALLKIVGHFSPFIQEEALLYYKDILDHLIHYFEFIDMLREEVAGLLEVHFSIKNHHLAETSNQVNQTVKRLTLLTTIFMPLTVITGIGGMSEWSMMTGPENWRYSYPLFIVLMIVVGIGGYEFLKIKKWL